MNAETLPMHIFFVHSQQKAMPASREYVPRIAACVFSFLVGLFGIILWVEAYWPPVISAGMLGVSLLLCVIAGGIFVNSAKTWKLADELEQKGVVIPGKIMSLWEEQNVSGRFFHARPGYYVLYTFDLSVSGNAPQEFAATQIIAPDLYRQLKIGMPVRIRVLLKNPNITRMETSPWKWDYPLYSKD